MLVYYNVSVSKLERNEEDHVWNFCPNRIVVELDSDISV